MGNNIAEETVFTGVKVTDLLIKQAFGFLFNDSFSVDSISEINVHPVAPEIEQPCIEITLSQNSSVDIYLFVQSIFLNSPPSSSGLPENLYVFRLSPVSFLANSLFFPEVCEYVGYRFFNRAGNSLDVFDLANLTVDQLFPPNTLLLNTQQGDISKFRLYFWKGTSQIVFNNPTFILRILSGIEERYRRLIFRAIQVETIRSPLPSDESMASEHVTYSCFDVKYFFDQFDAEFNYSNKCFKRKVINNEIADLLESNVNLYSGNYYNYFIRSEALFDSMEDVEFIKSAEKNTILLFFEEYIAKSPEGYLFCRVSDLGQHVYLSVFDAAYFQLDQIDMVTPNIKFSELPESEHTNDAILLFNGSFFKELHSDRAKDTPSVGYFSGLFPFVKGVPVGNYVFRNPKKIWNPRTETSIKEVDYSKYPSIGYKTKQEWIVYPTNEGRYYFAQNDDGEIEVGRFNDNSTWYTKDGVAVGCDNLVAFRIGDSNVSDLDTIALVRDEVKMPWYRLISSDEGYRRGFPFFGKILKNGKEYLFTLTVMDCSKNLGLEACRDFLSEIGATDILFSDGASSTGLIFKDKLLINPVEFKDQLITSAISIRKNVVDFKDILSRVVSKIELGGEFQEISNFVQGYSNQLSGDEMSNILSVINLQRPIPNFSGMRVMSRFGNRVNPITGNGIKFHSGIDIDMDSGTNIFPVLPGKIHMMGSNGGWGNYIIVYHGYDLLKTRYYTLYAHNTSTVGVVNSLVDRNTVIAISGATGNVTGPHLHLEVRVIKEGENFNVLSKEIVRDPQNIIFPKNLIIE